MRLKVKGTQSHIFMLRGKRYKNMSRSIHMTAKQLTRLYTKEELNDENQDLLNYAMKFRYKKEAMQERQVKKILKKNLNKTASPDG